MIISSNQAMIDLGVSIGRLLNGGELFELIGDVGAGKTTLTKGIAKGLGITDAIQSPTFTISRTYHSSRGLFLAHYDFYRLQETGIGIMADEASEVMLRHDTVTVIEWANAIKNILPGDRLSINIQAIDEAVREVTMVASGLKSSVLLKAIMRE